MIPVRGGGANNFLKMKRAQQVNIDTEVNVSVRVPFDK